MRKYRFYKEEGQWYIDLKFFPFNKAYLAMVQGADVLLDIVSEGKDEVTLQISTSPIPFSDGYLEKYISMGVQGGAYYYTREGFTKFESEKVQKKAPMVWLCPVTLWVFLRYPNKIYYKRL